MKIVEMPVATLVAAKAPYNPRVIAPEELEALKRSLAEFGLVEPVIFNERTGRVVGGHQRVDAMEALGWTTAPVNVVDLDEPREQALNLALNKISGQWDESKLRGLLDGLGNELAALAGFNAREQKAMAALGSLAMLEQEAVKQRVKQANQRIVEESKQGEVDKPVKIKERKDVGIKPGDLFELGDHRLLCGDSTNREDVLRVMGGELAMLVATDPPYMVNFSGERPAAGTGIDYSGIYREIEIEDASEFLTNLFRNVISVLAPHAAIYCWHGHKQCGEIQKVWKSLGILDHQDIVWVKRKTTFSRSFWDFRHEPCMMGWRAGSKPKHDGSQEFTSVWEIDWEDGSHEIGNVHPTQKPIEIFMRPMRKHTQPGDVCFEPFSGSGSQLIAGEKAGRRVRAIEIEPMFVDAAIRRWESLTGKKARRVD